jgi:O-antigen/teichoic acid export membrane protein
MATGSRAVDIARLAVWRRSATAGYAIGGLGLAIGGALLGSHLTAFGVATRFQQAVMVGLVALILATVMQLMMKLELSVFKAHHQTYVEQWVLSLATTLTYLAGLVGAYLDRPIEALALGALVSNGLLYLWVRAAARKQFPELFRLLVSASRPVNVDDFRDLVSHGKHFFSLSLVFVVREPVFRLLIAWILGAGPLGLYDIANRTPMLIRELGASGSQSLFAGLARTDSPDGRADTERVLRAALFYLLAIGGTGLAFFAVSRDLIFSVWLGKSAPAGLSLSGLLMSVWWGITLLNVPFYWLLQARGLEKPLANSVWLHAASVVAVVSLARSSLHGLPPMLGVWIVTGVATQAYIYLLAERATRLTSTLLLNRTVLLYLASCLVLACAGVLAQVKLGTTSLVGGIVFAVLWLVAYGVFCGPSLWKLRPAALTAGSAA